MCSTDFPTPNIWFPIPVTSMCMCLIILASNRVSSKSLIAFGLSELKMGLVMVSNEVSLVSMFPYVFFS